MATTRDTTATTGDTSSGQGAGAQKPQAAKLAEDFQPNEPKPKSGVDKDGNPDDSLSEKQLERSATEALLSLRPQPSADEVSKVLEALAEHDEHGQPKNKVKTAKEGGEKAVAELNKQRAG